MPFVPHTESDLNAMLEAINIKQLSDLYSEVPSDMPPADMSPCGPGLSEMAVTRLLQEREPDNKNLLCFIGAGAYEHHVPAAIWQTVTRGEFYTAYTPYQAEASQGSLEVIYRYQTMMTALMQMEVSNASLYDGATAVAEAALMAIRIHRGKKTKILYPANMHPAYKKVLHTILSRQKIPLQAIAFDEDGCMDQVELAKHLDQAAALVVSQPNMFGVIDEIDVLTNLAHQQGALVIAQVNPLAMATLKPPGCWGAHGADIACGEGQPFGVPLMSGGPYFGFMTTRRRFIRQLPGRIVAKTEDTQGRTGFTLTLQAREQHIRRGKATSNICTNQGLLVTAATMYLSLLGGKQLQALAQFCHQNTQLCIEKLTQLEALEQVFATPYFHECVLRLSSHRVSDWFEFARRKNLQPGFDLTSDFPELGQCFLVCVTETKTDEDIEYYYQQLKTFLETSP